MQKHMHTPTACSQGSGVHCVLMACFHVLCRLAVMSPSARKSLPTCAVRYNDVHFTLLYFADHYYMHAQHTACVQLYRCLAYTSTRSIEKWPQRRFSKALACGQTARSACCHGNSQQTRSAVGRRSAPSSGAPDPRATSTEHCRGTTSQMVAGAVRPALRLVN